MPQRDLVSGYPLSLGQPIPKQQWHIVPDRLDRGNVLLRVLPRRIAEIVAPLDSRPWNYTGLAVCEAAVVNVDMLFAQIPVSDFKAAQIWYERFFARPADVVAHETEVMWRVTDRGWLYIICDSDHAGHGGVAMAVSDIEVATRALQERGVATGPIAPEGDAGRKAVARDPDGNSIEIIEVATDA